MLMVGRPYDRSAARESSESGDSGRFDPRVDRQRAPCDGHRHAVVAVAQRVAVADGDDGDRGQHRAALLGEPDALPARPDGRGGAEPAVELRRPARLERAVDGGERDLAYPATGAGAAAQPALVE